MSFETVYLFASGDLRESANKVCWPAQKTLEAQLDRAARRLGVTLKRAHPVHADRGHGFLSSQREGMDAFARIPADAPVIVAEAVWQYSHHVLPGLIHHKGPILTVANWSGQWPGLVGMLNLNGSLTKAGVTYSTLWSLDFTDDYFNNGLKTWLAGGTITHDQSHVTELASLKVPARLEKIAADIAEDMIKNKRIMGVFDEGCMGMFNAIVPDHLLNPLGIFKERLSQSALYHETKQIPDAYADEAFAWLEKKGMKFSFDGDKDGLTLAQVKTQLKMYAAAARFADRFGCNAVGIQYQQGLKDLLPASDLAEGLLNNDDRPEVRNAAGQPIRPGKAITHFNEVDECAAVDGLLTDQVHRALGQPAENTLHDLRWGDVDATGKQDGFIWVFEISGAAPAAHHIGGYAGSQGFRQPIMYFPFGGATLSGVAKPGVIVWSRFYVADGKLQLDIGLGDVVELDESETRRRLDGTTKEWPIMHGRLRGVSQTQMMGRHKANHIHVAYGKDEAGARDAALTKAALARNLGVAVHWCGTLPG